VLAVSIIALVMEAASTYETSVIFYQNTRRNNPEDNHLFNEIVNTNSGDPTTFRVE
jgi:hypothetical protein